MKHSPIMVVLGETQWTLEALHLACAMARSQRAEVALVAMIPVRHPMMLGTPEGYLDYSRQQARAVSQFAATAQDYGVPFAVHLCQYASYLNAVVDMADQLGAAAVLATLPPSLLGWLRRYRLWWLRHRLAGRHCPLFTLEQPGALLEWSPPLPGEGQLPT